MSDIEQYRFGDREIRVIDLDGEPWWIARDVCDVLEIANITHAVAGLDDDEKATFRTTKGGPEQVIISEPGLYALVGRSRKPEARAFDRWVRHDVLPSIRRTGGYQSVPVNIEMTINAFAEAYHDEHVVPVAARILAFRRHRKPRKGIEAFVQLTLDIKLPAIDAVSKKEIGR